MVDTLTAQNPVFRRGLKVPLSACPERIPAFRQEHGTLDFSLILVYIYFVARKEKGFEKPHVPLSYFHSPFCPFFFLILLDSILVSLQKRPPP